MRDEKRSGGLVLCESGHARSERRVPVVWKAGGKLGAREEKEKEKEKEKNTFQVRPRTKSSA